MSSLPRRCSNCSDLFVDCPTIIGNRRKNIFQDLYIITENKDGRTIQSTKVETALSSIYKLNYLKKLHCIQNIDDPLLQLPVVRDDCAEEELGICKMCHSVLTNLVKFYNEFNQLRQLDSALNKRIKNLDSLISSVPTIINNSQKKIVTTNNNNNHDQPSEEKEEEGLTENYNDDNNYLDSNDFVSNLTEVEYDDSVGCLQSDVNEDNNGDEKSREITFDRVPTVNILRLSSEEIQAHIREISNKKLEQDIKPELESDDDNDSDFSLSDEQEKQRKAPSFRRPNVHRSRLIRVSNNRRRYEKTNKKLKGNPSNKRPDDPIELLQGACPMCNRSFKNPAKLVTHLKTHVEVKDSSSSSQEKFSCPIPNCTKSFTQVKHAFLYHLREHAQDLPFPCPVPGCQKKFPVAYRKQLHLVTHRKDGHYVCGECEVIFESLELLTDHLATAHPETYVDNSCPACPEKIFKTDRFLNEHMEQVHPEEKLFVCKICSTSFNLKQALVSHFKYHTELQAHPSKQETDSSLTAHPVNVNSCPACPGQFIKTKTLLDKHVEEMHPGEKLFVCKICSNFFARKRQLLGHSRSHSKFKCEYCTMRPFVTEEGLERHLEICRGQVTYTCSICEKTFKDKHRFMIHEKVHKGEAKEFKCSYEGCSKVYYDRRHLEAHLTNHANKLHFTCDQCGARFNLEKALKRHYRIHSGQKSFLCPTCGKSFLRGTEFKKHMLTHTDTKGYICKDCGRPFKFSNSLRLHVLNHHTETRFVCSICGAGFSYNWMLKKHMSKVHSS